MKKIAAIFSPPQGHWVGDGFPVRSLFSDHKIGAAQISPFLLLDYAGEVSQRDSTGEGGTIGPSDVHEEFHSQSFSRTGGIFEIVQLWVNLRAKDKTIAPRYQTITANMIPKITLPHAAGVCCSHYCRRLCRYPWPCPDA